MKMPEGVEMKDANKTKASENEAGAASQDAFKDMLSELLGNGGDAARRARCLEFALQLPELSGPDEAIAAAKAFNAYIMGENK